jgi:peptide/nickel transport system substrate-binding protein
MAEAGYARGVDGVWTHPSAGRFAFEQTVLQSPQNENEMHIMASSWREAGFDVAERVWGAAQSSDAQLRATHPSLANTSAGSGTPGEILLSEYLSATVPTAQNRWAGSNRGGWVNPEFDRVAERFNATLARGERVPLLAEMARVFSEDVAVISLYFNVTSTAFAATLRGPKVSVPEGTMAWDVHEWQWIS